MPIYAYKCSYCGFANDVLQKLSDPVLTDCPSCAQPGFAKQVTAAGFQLKGSGWYATDFKGTSQAAASPAKDKTDSSAKAASDGTASPSTTPAPKTAPASACGGACACHS